MTAAERITSTVLTVAACGLLSGCGVAGPPVASADEQVYECLGTPIPASALTGEPSLDELSETGRAAIESATYEGVDPLDISEQDGWFVISEDETTIVLLRSAEAASHAAGEEMPPGDQEMLTVSYIAEATNLDPGWYVVGHSTCSLRVELSELAPVDVALDPSAVLDDASTSVALLVTEQECNSGEDAEGRIEVLSLVETATSVQFVIGVTPRGGDQACPENPPTPFVLELASPLGDRRLVDAGLVPAAELRAVP